MSLYKQRIRKIKKLFEPGDGSAALLLSSAPQVRKSRDTYYPYRQDSDFYYLTGSGSQELTLLVTSNGGTPVLIAPPADPVKSLWDGPQVNPRSIAKSLGAEVVTAKDPRKEVMSRLKGVDTLYYQNLQSTLGWEIANELASTPSHERVKLPKSFKHSDVLIEPLRCHKEPHEIRLMCKAANVTNTVLHLIAAQIQPGVKESDVANTIEYFIKMAGCEVAFSTIVASGPSAAVLHYQAHSRTAKRGEMILIDCGAQFEMYAADITRTLPVGGKYTPLQAELCAIVLEAQAAAIKAVRHGARIGSSYNAAARVITEGLIDLGVLRGKVSALMKRKAYKPYFPHGIGHTLGLDVHDIGAVRGNNEAILKKGMVITIEPGLYFAKKTGKIPACGVRIEDDVLVTGHGCKVLTEGFPKELGEVEELLIME